MKKRLLASLLAATMVFSMLTTAALAEGENASGSGEVSTYAADTTVYVGGAEDASVSGHYTTITEALHALPDETGQLTVMLTGAVTETSDISIPTDKGITGVLLTSAGDDPEITGQSGAGLYANGVPLTVAHGTFNNWKIYGGGKENDAASTSLTITGGVFGDSNFYGGGYNASAGDTNLTITGGTFDDASAYGGYDRYDVRDTNTFETKVTGTAALTMKNIEGTFNFIAGGSNVQQSGSRSVTDGCDINNIKVSIENCTLTFDSLLGGGNYAMGQFANCTAAIGSIQMTVSGSSLTAVSYANGFYGGSIHTDRSDDRHNTLHTGSIELNVIDSTVDTMSFALGDYLYGNGGATSLDQGSLTISNSEVPDIYQSILYGKSFYEAGDISYVFEDVPELGEAVLYGVFVKTGEDALKNPPLTTEKLSLTLKGEVAVENGFTMHPNWYDYSNSSLGTTQQNAAYTISAATDMTLSGDLPADTVIEVVSPDGYLITSCTVNDVEKMNASGSVTLRGLKANDRIVTKMVELQTSDVVYISAAGDDANTGDSPDAPVKSWEKAYQLLNAGGTIVVMGDVEVLDSGKPFPAKAATITGSYGGTNYDGALVPGTTDNYVFFSIGADTVIENLKVDCSGNPTDDGLLNFYANGNDLTIGENVQTIPFPNAQYTPLPCIHAGGGNLAPEGITGGTITVKSGAWEEINAGSWDTLDGAELYLYGGVTVGYLEPSDASNAEIHIVEGSAENPTTIGRIYANYDGDLLFSGLYIEDGGYLLLTDGDHSNSAIESAVVDLYIAEGGTLKAENCTLEGAFTGNMTGGGTLVLPSGCKLTIPGSISGQTALEILPEQSTGEDYADGCKLGVYVTAGTASSGTFMLVNEIAAVLTGNADATEWTLSKAAVISYDLNGGTGAEGVSYAPETIQLGETHVVKAAPSKSGCTFAGWSDGTTIYQPGDIFTAQSTVALTAQWKENGGGTTWYTVTAGAGEGGSINPSGSVRIAGGSNKTFTITPEAGYRISNVLVDGENVGAVGQYTFENVRKDHSIEAVFVKGFPIADPDDTGISAWLETKDHKAFLNGYTDRTFGPDRNMTRAEAAQLFYNLLLDKEVAVTVSFTDVPAEAWYAEAVNTLASLGIVQGIGNGLYDPERFITRAEFTVIAMRFANLDTSGENIFTDVNADDWFYAQVVGSIRYGWINGYEDGTFRPNNTITRAEVTTITNRMLGRTADVQFVDRHADALRQFPDVSSGHWAYYDIMEAANAHDYTKENGVENWTGLQ